MFCMINQIPLYLRFYWFLFNVCDILKVVTIDLSLELNGFKTMPVEEFPTGSCSFLKTRRHIAA